jgi:Flp pilus assembly protein TadG
MGGRERGEHGQTVVEFVLMLPFLLLVIMALAEFGGAFYSYITINNATSEAARWASVANLPDDACGTNSIQWRASQMSRGLIACDSVTIGYHNPVADQYTRGSGVAVRVNHIYQPVTPLPALIQFVSGGTIPAAWPMTTCSDARLEQRPAGSSLPAGDPCGAGG